MCSELLIEGTIQAQSSLVKGPATALWDLNLQPLRLLDQNLNH